MSDAAGTPDRPGTTSVKGFAMGLSDSVPGISGGTVALILGIHPRLVRAIAGLGRDALVDVRHGRWADAWRRIDGNFLLLLGLGLALGIVTGAKLIEVALELQPTALMAILFGLMAISVRVPARVPDWGVRDGVAAALSFVLAFSIAVTPSITAPEAWWFLPVAGAIAACAMILPGISGGALLLLMGLYEPIIGAIANFHIAIIGLVGIGAVVGLLSFSKGLRAMLDRHEGTTHAAMVGLLLGGLALLWPWRSEAGFALGRPAAPDGWMPLLFIAVGLAIGGLLEFLGRRPPAQQE